MLSTFVVQGPHNASIFKLWVSTRACPVLNRSFSPMWAAKSMLKETAGDVISTNSGMTRCFAKKCSWVVVNYDVVIVCKGWLGHSWSLRKANQLLLILYFCGTWFTTDTKQKTNKILLFQGPKLALFWGSSASLLVPWKKGESAPCTKGQISTSSGNTPDQAMSTTPQNQEPKNPGNQKPWNWKSEILKNSQGFDNSDSLVHELHERWWKVLLFWCDSKLIHNSFCMEKGDLRSPWGPRGIHEFSRDFSKILDSRKPVQTAV